MRNCIAMDETGGGILLGGGLLCPHLVKLLQKREVVQFPKECAQNEEVFMNIFQADYFKEMLKGKILVSLGFAFDGTQLPDGTCFTDLAEEGGATMTFECCPCNQQYKLPSGYFTYRSLQWYTAFEEGEIKMRDVKTKKKHKCPRGKFWDHLFINLEKTGDDKQLKLQEVVFMEMITKSFKHSKDAAFAGLEEDENGQQVMDFYRILLICNSCKYTRAYKLNERLAQIWSKAVMSAEILKNKFGK